MVLTLSHNFAISVLKWLICNKKKQREIWLNNHIMNDFFYQRVTLFGITQHITQCLSIGVNHLSDGWSVCLSFGVSVCLSAVCQCSCLFIWLTVCYCGWLSVCLNEWLTDCLPECTSACLSVYTVMYVNYIYMSVLVCLFACLLVYLFVDWSEYNVNVQDLNLTLVSVELFVVSKSMKKVIGLTILHKTKAITNCLNCVPRKH